jgi:hypothetical protein
VGGEQPVSDVVVRVGRPADSRAVLALITASGATTDGINDLLAGTGGHVLVAIDEGRVVGAVGIAVDGGSTVLRTLGVEQRRRRDGVDRLLVAAALHDPELTTGDVSMLMPSGGSVVLRRGLGA